jgi:hypothetical protein
MELINGSYGYKDQQIDITSKLMQFYTKEKMIISSNINLNDLFSDPAVGIKKILTLKIKNDDKIYEIELQETNSRLIEDFDSSNQIFDSLIQQITCPSQITINPTHEAINSTQLTINPTQETINSTQLTINPTQEAINSTQLTINPTQETIN